MKGVYGGNHQLFGRLRKQSFGATFQFMSILMIWRR
jgi:hypothetical protein